MSSFRLILVSVFLLATYQGISYSQEQKNEMIYDQSIFFNDNVYSSSISFGYTRTNDNYKFYPESGVGSFYISGNLVYDRAKNIRLKDMLLNEDDYLSFDFYLTYDWGIRENYFNIDMLIYGKNKFLSQGNSSKRSLYGFFNGLEYFRPGFSNSALTWDQSIKKEHPHLQYIIWRAMQWTIIDTYSSDNSLISTRFSAGFGPSINSSLTATDISPEKEDELSHIFRCMRYRKENYYYSAAIPISVEFTADKIRGFKFSTGYNFYFFFPIQNEKAYDIVNIFRLSAGYYLLDNCLLDLHYEYWKINSTLRDIKRDHWWNRMIMEIRFCF